LVVPDYPIRGIGTDTLATGANDSGAVEGDRRYVEG
jgi:hypothetical protein